LGHGERPTLDELRPDLKLTQELVIPTLLKILNSDDATSVISSATMSLAKIGSDSCGDQAGAVEEALRALLDEGNQEISETAALALGLFGRAESATVLVELLSDSKAGRKLVGGGAVATRTRAFAAYGLGQLSRRTPRAEIASFVTSALVAVVDGDDTPDEVSLAAFNALSVVPLAGSPELLNADIRVSPSSSRAALVNWLGAKCKDSSLSDRVRAHVPRTMALHAAEGTVDLKADAAELLMELLTERRVDRELRYGVVMALGLLGDAGPEAAPIRALLMHSAKHGDTSERHLALMSLGQVTSRPGPLAESAWESAAEVEAYLRAQLSRGKSRAKPWAALALGVQGAGQLSHGRVLGDETSDALRAMSRDCGSPADAGAYAVAIGLRMDIEAAPLLQERLASFADQQARGDLCLALGLLGEAANIPSLQEVFIDAVYQPHLLSRVVMALTLCRDKSLVPTLVKEMKASGSSSVRAVHAWSLGLVGDTRAVDPLVGLLKDTEQTTLLRIQVANGLGFVCDPEHVPWSTSLKEAANYITRAETLLGGSPSGVLEI